MKSTQHRAHLNVRIAIFMPLENHGKAVQNLKIAGALPCIQRLLYEPPYSRPVYNGIPVICPQLLTIYTLISQSIALLSAPHYLQACEMHQ